MPRVEVSALVDRPVQEVWDFFIDLTNSPRWTRSGSELRQTSDGPLGPGTTIESVRVMFGREIKSQKITVTEYEPGRHLSIEAMLPVVGHVPGGFTFETVGDGTRLSRWGELDLGRAEGILGSTLTRLVRRVWRTEMANLKRLIEGRPAPA